MVRKRAEDELEFDEDELAALVGPYWEYGDPLPAERASTSRTIGFLDLDDSKTGRSSSQRTA
jgi:hypothetical protein